MAAPRPDEQAIFEVARKIDSREARDAYLRQICGDDAAIAQRVQALLKAYEESASFLESPAAAVGATGAFGPKPENETAIGSHCELPGTMIGPYKLLQQIGEGGMGTVYMAGQTQPIQRKVALKIIKAGMDSRQVIARFEAERQALAMMDHVNIARVFDGGTTEYGLPYFVMELVHGVPITRYCDDNHLTPRERLELFVPVCQAIQHAHQKGIIHRDIKPTNVMVTLYDGKPVPKVIDFGVAKATEQKLTERTLFTQYGTMVGTLEYMSPEQAEMSALGVDTRSDIYSLGVLLYELLTGSTPLTHKRMKDAAYAEILRMIREVEPPRPSTRLSDSGEALASISAQRHMEPAKLSKLMRGELDWIVMKTLEKDRGRRYETANAFAADVQRYLADETVLACPPSAGYRFRKFARRNKRALVTATLLGGTLLAAAVLAVVVLVVSNMAISRERDEKAEALKQKGEALEQKAEALVRTNEARAKAQLNAERAEANFQAALGVADQMQGISAGPNRQGINPGPNTTLAESRMYQTLREKARQIFLQLVEENTGNPETRLQLAWAYVRLAKAELRLEELDKAIAAERHAIILFEQLVADSPDVPNHRLELVRCYWTLASRLDRQPDDRVVRANAVGVLGWAQQSPLVATLALGNTQTRPGAPEVPEATQARSRALALCERSAADFPNDSKFMLRLVNECNRLAQNSRRGAEKVAVYRSVRAICCKMATDFPDKPESTRGLAQSCHDLAGALPAAAQEAAELLQQELVIRQKLVADFHQPVDMRWLGDDYKRRGELLVKEGRPREAVEPFRQAAELLQQELAIRHKLVAGFHRPQDIFSLGRDYEQRGHLLFNEGRNREAVEPYRQAMVLYEQLPVPQTNISLDHVYSNLGFVLKKTGQPHEAERIFRKAAELFASRVDSAKRWPSGYPDASPYYKALGDILKETGRPQAAEQAYRQGLAIEVKQAAFDEQLGLFMKSTQEMYPKHRMGLADQYASLGRFLKDTGRLPEAEQAYRQAVDVRKKLAADCPTHTMFRADLARTYADLGKFLRDTGQPQMAGQAYGRAWEAYHQAEVLGQILLQEHWLLSRGEQDALTAYELGEGLEATGQLQEAEQAFRRAAEISQRLFQRLAADNPDGPRCRHNWALTLTGLGRLLSRQGKHTEAEAAYREAIRLESNDAMLHYLLGLTLVKQDKLVEAVAVYREAIRLKPNDAEPHYQLGRALWEQGLRDQAKAAYREAIRRDSAKPEWLGGVVGPTLASQGAEEEALAAYDEAIRRKPDYALAHNNLAWFLAFASDRKFRDGKRAVEVAKKAHELGHRDWNTLGAAYFCAGDGKAAVLALEKSMELRKGGDGPDWFLLAMTHWKLGNKDEARKRFDQAVQWMEKNQEALKKNRSYWEELIRLRVEAGELLEIKSK